MVMPRYNRLHEDDSHTATSRRRQLYYRSARLANRIQAAQHVFKTKLVHAFPMLSRFLTSGQIILTYGRIV